MVRRSVSCPEPGPVIVTLSEMVGIAPVRLMICGVLKTVGSKTIESEVPCVALRLALIIAVRSVPAPVLSPVSVTTYVWPIKALNVPIGPEASAAPAAVLTVFGSSVNE